MKEYVCGFMFSPDGKQVVLIEKNRPDWMKGLHNGVGGKIEYTDRSIYHAVVREFSEEAGVLTTPDDWQLFGSLDVKGYGKIHLLKCFSEDFEHAKKVESEVIRIVQVDELNRYKSFRNLSWIIPMALDNDVQFSEVRSKK